MKKLITLVSLFIIFTAQAQTHVTKDANGNYVMAKRDTSRVGGKLTGKTITDADGQVHPLYISRLGNLFYMRTSKAGNVYKCYIKE